MYPLRIVVTSLLLSLLLYFLLKPKNAKKHKVPPSPTRLPIIGNLHQLGSSPHRSLSKLSQKYGPLMLMHLGSTPTLVVSSEEAAQEIFKTHDLVFSERPPAITSDELFYRRWDVAFAPFGEYWRQVRKISVLQLLSAKMVESFRGVREEVTCMVEKISSLASGTPIDLSKIIISTTNNMVCRIALGKKYYDEKLGGGTDFQHLLAELFRLLGIIHIGDIFPSLAWIERLTGRCRCKTEKEFPTNGRDNFAAGTDTTYAAIVWTLAELIRHPAAMKKVQEEIRRSVVHRNSSNVVTEDDTRKMQYLRCVIKESLRLHPPLPLLIPRKSTQDVEVQGFHIPAKTAVLVNAWAIGRDPKTWTEPEKFLPERFLDSEVDFRGQDFTLIPFGAGRRGCPGIPFTIATIEIVVANVLHPICVTHWKMYPLLIVVTSLFFSLLLLYLGLNPKNAEKYQVPPSPTRLPIIGNLHQLGSLPHRSLWKLSQKYGSLMFMHLGSVPTLIVSSEEAAQEILKTHELGFSDRPSSITSDELLYRGRDVAFAPCGDYWRQLRKISVLQLLSSKRVESFRGVREEEVACMVEKISSQASGTPIDRSKIIIWTTCNMVCRIALGKKYDEEKLGGRTDFHHLLEELFILLGTIHIGDIFPSLAWIGRLNGLDARFKKNFQLMDEFLEQVIEEHMAEDKKNSPPQYGTQDLVHILLEIRRDGSMSVPLDRDSIKAVILDNFAAGADSTYSAIVWTLAELIRHPAATKKVQEEIRRSLLHRNSSKVVSESEIHKMPYLKCVIKESLRLHPPVPLVKRKSTQHMKVKGFDVPANTAVLINAWAIGRDPKSWTEPEKFLPERFIDSGVDFRGQHFKLIPFGAGRRGCPGIAFTIATIEIVLANVLDRFDWQLPAGEEHLDMTEIFGTTVHKKSLLLVPRPRY
ncbi:hypothetical protein H6P81_013393 [Aristolochia fimbriata]|uniref:Cytochrome P450 n=1 Tax=Aristolochia fimbriata TaxID=158543 RepID=A0AAV7EGS5_ARIFI|nr:hypothetical protein H6P81_013393 [Aristolochia fimbriata]